VKFESQRVAWWFFATCMLLFTLQLVYGLIMGFAHAGHDGLHDLIPFHVARAVHTNLLVVWLLTGFMGAAYFIIPEECDRELYWPKLAYVQLIALVVVGVVAIIGFHLQWWEGRKFLEIPRPLDYLVVIDVLLFIANIGMTIWKGRRMTTTAMVLFFGLLMAALLYLPGMLPSDNQTIDSYWRWWVVHLWVEGVWELIMGAILSFLLIKLTGVDREVIEKWLYVIVGFTFLSGILGTGHHYYYIGTPRYWLLVGGLFSALEPLAFLGMAIYAIAMARRGGRNHPNRIALQWTIGCSVMSFVGAGFLGFAHTIPQVNLYTHGTLVTAMHGHMAFWGAYAMLVLAIIAYALPLLTGRRRHDSGVASFAFWTSNIGMIAMTLAFARRRHHPGRPRAPGRYGLRHGAEGDRDALLGAHPRRDLVHPRHRRLRLRLHPPRQAGGRGRRRRAGHRQRWGRGRGVTAPYYREVGDEVRAFTAAHATRTPVLLKGPTGCGKSRFVEAMAARLSRPLVTVACNDETSAHDLIGRWLVKGGDTEWQDGPVTRAVKRGAILYLDEVAEAREDVIVVLHPLADHRRELHVDRLDQTFAAAEGFMLVASFNPAIGAA
jgi:nitric oxide reductase subunit B